MEEIMIDRVNVAGCYWKCKDGDCAMYYADLSADNNELEFGFNCEDNTDCYFKQLKRLEQENKMLQELKDEDSLRVVQLAKENAELKKELQKYKDMEAKGLEEFKDVGGCWGCGIQLASDEYFATCKKYKQALEEIRDMFLNQVAWCGQLTPFEEKIYKIINEVLGNENNSK